ncbi:MAG: prepilin-type N-terminal cleavage/methylation domain-containing protein [Candidatus Riflebacteria bacterium]|nr:prepilin-type N-terminal cleavage/methylation domain-containing protein [Candidatus Riflebacteria bacterium]
MKRGFSLIELLVVITIIAILVGIAAPYYTDYVKESKIAKCKADLDILRQAVILYNAREDIPYQGNLATQPHYLPIFGETDFVGLQGQYLTNIPLDPWSKNYKLDPYGCFVFSDGIDSRTRTDDVRDYYVKELALRKVEWEDLNGDRVISSTGGSPDLIYLHFNKSVSLSVSGDLSAYFDVLENNEVVSSYTLSVSFAPAKYHPGYNPQTCATVSTLICEVGGGQLPKVGVHSIALKDDPALLTKFAEVYVSRENCWLDHVETRVEERPGGGGLPLRYAVRTAPVKIVPKS